MATGDGEMDRRGEGGSRPRRRPPPPPADEPTQLDKDLPWPPTYQPNLGPGGEELDEGLVAIGADDRGPPAAKASRLARRPGRFPRVRMAIPRVSSGRTAILGGVAAIVMLAAVVIPSIGGTGSLDPASDRTAGLTMPTGSRSSAEEWIAASERLNARLEAAADRRREAARERRERARGAERRQQRAQGPAAPPPAGTPKVTPVVQAPSAPARAVDPWPGVSQAERAFTPGPWNLE
ncbi:MAG: hypothetical protein AB7I38_15245 [Dehalococcoidia bacterium]